ncbi:ATP-dependent DNA ligase [Rathayibacter sp. VKM Ac-2760]|uniref:DUF7882 family protein n=1 Tax=Rathayibacter sp. VKM Ac-2760 TaxID=2609253 RepID=UPI001316AE50|nr:ATP-dependent DNA ligase [Rathayibacter sp. VKM Ac-2760]QHC57324.1 ATP-dependent DNA ligase [Rathayibacter sp. VKM Ac-2760]
MGRLLYGAPPSAHPFEDRVLAHLQSVITSRFRRGEGFLLTLDDDGRRSELWLHPAIALRYEYDGTSEQELDPHWLRALTAASHGRLGLHIVPEPDSTADPRERRTPA